MKNDEYLRQYIKLVKAIDTKAIEDVVDLLWKKYESKNHIFFVGNGGSASTASHFAADLSKNVTEPFKHAPALKALALTDNTSFVTAISNDRGFDYIFSTQLECFGSRDDLLVLISASGNSKNLISAANIAKKMKIDSLALLGFDGGVIKELVDVPIIVRSYNYGLVESIHGFLQHTIIEELKLLVKKKYG